jgi:hypothetical protein
LISIRSRHSGACGFQTTIICFAKALPEGTEELETIQETCEQSYQKKPASKVTKRRKDITAELCR